MSGFNGFRVFLATAILAPIALAVPLAACQGFAFEAERASREMDSRVGHYRHRRLEEALRASENMLIAERNARRADAFAASSALLGREHELTLARETLRSRLDEVNDQAAEIASLRRKLDAARAAIE